MNELEKNINEFIESHPQIDGAYGYGSGVFKQSGYSANDSVQIDLIMFVQNLKKWHEENMELNQKEYTYFTRKWFQKSSKETIKGANGITYISNIPFKNNTFKYGVMETKDFINQCHTWDSIYVPGRFQKTSLELVSTDEIRKSIKYNRDSALQVACLLNKTNVETKKLLYDLIRLSYTGDIRMLFAENPEKINNIIQGSFDKYMEIYGENKDYASFLGNHNVEIEHQMLLKDIEKLPEDLVVYLRSNEVNLKNLTEVRRYIEYYFYEKNRKESFLQTLHGVKTNGIGKSLPYAGEKIKKRFKRK